MDDQQICQHQAADPVPAASTSASRRHRVAGGRPRHVKIRFTDAEYDAIAARAVEAGVSIPRLLVDGALIRRRRPVVPTALTAELAGLRRLVANLANNVNQIARKLNSGGVPDNSIPVTADALCRTLSRLDAALSGLGPLAPQPRTRSGPLRNAVPPPRSTAR
ncbi:MAG TPA: plasmid mobilization relaxosome protein MobC [Streptosporangiaceae bacterium]|nr:plasmid mobilization relaxosome protein MobC [Streptosporangiaceae bacterium]